MPPRGGCQKLIFYFCKISFLYSNVVERKKRIHTILFKDLLLVNLIGIEKLFVIALVVMSCWFL
jgi:hypothetical protein